MAIPGLHFCLRLKRAHSIGKNHLAVKAGAVAARCSQLFFKQEPIETGIQL
jgi:hypothetical protein